MSIVTITNEGIQRANVVKTDFFNSKRDQPLANGCRSTP